MTNYFKESVPIQPKTSQLLPGRLPKFGQKLSTIIYRILQDVDRKPRYAGEPPADRGRNGTARDPAGCEAVAERRARQKSDRKRNAIVDAVVISKNAVVGNCTFPRLPAQARLNLGNLAGLQVILVLSSEGAETDGQLQRNSKS